MAGGALYFGPDADLQQERHLLDAQHGRQPNSRRTTASRRARSSRSSVTVKKKHNAEAALLMLGGCNRSASGATRSDVDPLQSVAGERPMKAANARTSTVSAIALIVEKADLDVLGPIGDQPQPEQIEGAPPIAVEPHHQQVIGLRAVPGRGEIRRPPILRDRGSDLQLADIEGETDPATRGVALG
jgi:hypothetical protein